MLSCYRSFFGDYYCDFLLFLFVVISLGTTQLNWLISSSLLVLHNVKYLTGMEVTLVVTGL